METGKRYKWMVKRGSLEIWLQDARLMLNVDAEGASSCHLTIQDSLDVFSILQELGQQLWDSRQSAPEYHQVVVQEQPNTFSWSLEGGTLKIFLDETCDYLQVTFAGGKTAALEVHHVSEAAQVIRSIVENSVGQR